MINKKRKKGETKKNRRIGLIAISLSVSIAIVLVLYLVMAKPYHHHIPVEAPSPDGVSDTIYQNLFSNLPQI